MRFCVETDLKPVEIIPHGKTMYNIQEKCNREETSERYVEWYGIDENKEKSFLDALLLADLTVISMPLLLRRTSFGLNKMALSKKLDISYLLLRMCFG